MVKRNERISSKRLYDRKQKGVQRSIHSSVQDANWEVQLVLGQRCLYVGVFLYVISVKQVVKGYICQKVCYQSTTTKQLPKTLCLAYISRLTPKCRMICRLTPKSCVMYAGLRLAKTFVCCCPDQLNKRLTDSKIESVRRKLCSVRAKSTFVVASSQSQ